jgi:hypothetical protein
MKTFDTLQFKVSKKEWNPNPWAVCNESVGTGDTPKRERCIQDVKRKQKKSEQDPDMIKARRKRQNVEQNVEMVEPIRR